MPYEAEVLVPIATSEIVLQSRKLAEVEYPDGTMTGSNILKLAEVDSWEKTGLAAKIRAKTNKQTKVFI